MSELAATPDSRLPEPAGSALARTVACLREVLGTDLVALVLFGSAAEGRLRAASDINLLVLLSSFRAERAEALREPLRIARAAVRLECMFLLASELEVAAEVFPVKFADIVARHRVLHGPDLVSGLVIPRPARIAQLRQTLLNSTLRLRAAFVAQGRREEQMAHALAEAAGPMRAAAASLLDLEGHAAPAPKEALERLGRELGERWTEPLARLSRSRQQGSLPAGESGPALLALAELAGELRARAGKLH